jgi:2-amino-4-hydroxy-6-hydroxymethyldihydropteridine diphosphokinase
MEKNEIVYLLTGSNIGDRLAFLQQAEKEIEDKIGVIQAKSSYYESQAWGNTEQENFWNQCLEVSTTLSAEEVLSGILGIEKEMGRIRKGEWQAREIDIDILFYGEEIIKTDDLQVPHARFHERNFAIIPMMEVNGDYFHPVLELHIDEIFFDCEDPLEVYILDFEA